MSVCYYFLNLLRDYKGGNNALVFLVMLYTVSRKRHCFGLLYLPTFINQFYYSIVDKEGRIIEYSVQILFFEVAIFV